MYCTNCGHELGKDEIYCTNCGFLCKDSSESSNSNISSSNSSFDLSMIFGILSCVLVWIPVISVPLAVVSLVIGINSRRETKKFSVGIVLGIISLVLTVLLILLLVFFINVIATEVEFDDDYQKDIIEYYREKVNDISGYSWLGDDGSMLYLYRDFDRVYEWYEKDSNHEDNYHKGTYDVYQGKDALDYINTNLKEFGFDEEKQKEFFNENRDINDYYLIILTCEKLKANGEESDGDYKKLYYYGTFLDELERFDGVNIYTGKKVSFVKKEYLKSRITV